MQEQISGAFPSEGFTAIAPKRFIRTVYYNFFLFQVCSIEFDRKDIVMNKLVATTLESTYHVFDLRTQHPTKGFASLKESVSLQFRSLQTPSLVSQISNSTVFRLLLEKEL